MLEIDHISSTARSLKPPLRPMADIPVPTFAIRSAMPSLAASVFGRFTILGVFAIVDGGSVLSWRYRKEEKDEAGDQVFSVHSFFCNRYQLGARGPALCPAVHTPA